MSTEIEEVVERNPIEWLSTSLIKTVIHNATGRDVGMEIQATLLAAAGKASMTTIRLKDSKPGHVIITADERVGFNVDDMSYITTTPAYGKKFMRWLGMANKKALTDEDYGQPECVFRRCV